MDESQEPGAAGRGDGMSERGLTVVSFHAHPDDEALFTGGTLAKAASEGHRVVLVVATLGERGLADPNQFDMATLAERRRTELQESADRLGCARVVVLGYADSGSEPLAANAPDTAPMHATANKRGPFATADVDGAAWILADILMQEQADVLTTYDANGGYGHPDHMQVHRVGARAAYMAGTPIVLEATLDRSKLTRAVQWMQRFSWIAPGLDLPDFSGLYTAPEDLTHRIDVRGHLDAKRDAMRAHTSQATTSSGERTLAFLLRLPRPVARRVLGTEWFIDRGRVPSASIGSDIFATPPRGLLSANVQEG